MRTALVVIDIQNDYFPGGKYPLWNTDATLESVLQTIKLAQKRGDFVVLVQHIADAPPGAAPFFNKDSEGVAIHPRMIEAAPDAPIITKSYADGFVKTDLEAVLSQNSIGRLVVCGMMTQNCVTHTAISKSAEKYDVVMLSDCCTSVDQMIHGFGLRAVSTRLSVKTAAEEYGAQK